MKYKVGETVTIRSDLEIGTLNGGIDFVDGMKNTLGKIVTIKSVHRTHFTIKENIFGYSLNMIQPKINKLFKLL